MRLPNNAYDALRTYTQQLLDEGVPQPEIFQTQLVLLSNIPIFKEEVSRLRDDSNRELSEYARSRLLRLPAVGLKIPRQTQTPAAAPVATPTTDLPTRGGDQGRPDGRPSTTLSSSPASPVTQNVTDASTLLPSNEASENQKSQRADYIRMQREREQAARNERERIKAQIKADREERRRLDDLRKQNQQPLSSDPEDPTASKYARAGSSIRSGGTQLRVQVRTLDGTTMRNTFPASSSISTHVRPWIDSATPTTTPYNLKLILTPLPNRTIEAGEEETPLSDLNVVGSATFVMVPVRGYVESYSSGRTGLLGQNGVLGGVGGMVSGGYNLVSGTAGWALGGVKSLLGYGDQGEANGQTLGSSSTSRDTAAGSDGPGPAKSVRIRTLADQRAEEAKKDQQFYNGNQLNFEPKKDDEGKKD
jgi:hypothetical protein